VSAAPGGLLIAPKSADIAAPGATTADPGPAGGSSAPAAARDLSPRVEGAGDGRSGSGAVPSPEAAQLGLPEELALDDLFPPSLPTGGAGATATPDAPAPTGPAPAGDAVADYGHARQSNWPLLAGLVVTLAILVFGGGFLWWRNRDSYYWPA
jgi:hypothetical protein